MKLTKHHIVIVINHEIKYCRLSKSVVVLWIPTAKWGKSARKPSALRVVGDDDGGWKLA